VAFRAAILLALVLSGIPVAATELSQERSRQLTAYCGSAQPLLRHPALDPASVSAAKAYIAPRPTVVMGQKVQAASRRLSLEGSVVLGLVINSVGRAAHLAVLEKSQHAELDSEALSILKAADFSPATVDGTPVRACTLLKVTFKVVE
jgi:TonB family protein